MGIHCYSSSCEGSPDCELSGFSAVASARVIPVPWQSGQSSHVSINRLAPPKKDVCPEPPQPIHGVVFLRSSGDVSVILYYQV